MQPPRLLLTIAALSAGLAQTFASFSSYPGDLDGNIRNYAAQNSGQAALDTVL